MFSNLPNRIRRYLTELGVLPEPKNNGNLIIDGVKTDIPREFLPIIMIGANGNEPIESHTRMQKLIFLFQQKHNVQNGYDFTPEAY